MIARDIMDKWFYVPRQRQMGTKSTRKSLIPKESGRLRTDLCSMLPLFAPPEAIYILNLLNISQIIRTRRLFLAPWVLTKCFIIFYVQSQNNQFMIAGNVKHYCMYQITY
jgi:hypothetical protein